MRISGKIAGDLAAFSRDVTINEAVGILRIWIVVLGAQTARFFEVDHNGINHIGDAVKIETKATPKPDEGTEQFFANLTSWLSEALNDNPFDRLIIVASENLLRLWSKSAAHPVICRLIGEVKMDLASLDIAAQEVELKKMVLN